MKLLKALGLGIFVLGCSYYTAINPNEIKDVNSFIEIERKCKEIPRFSEMNWEEAIEYVQLPLQAQRYNDWLRLRNYIGEKKDDEFKAVPFSEIHERAINGAYKNDCLEGAIAIASLLADNNYPSLVLVMGNNIGKNYFGYSHLSHGIFVYKKNGKWGSVGILEEDFRFPIYNNLEEILEDTNKKLNRNFKSYKLIDLRKEYGWNFINTKIKEKRIRY